MPIDLGYPSHDYLHDRPGYRGTSLQEFFHLLPDDESCLAHVFVKRFGDAPWCQKCGKHSSKWYRISGTRRFQHFCGYSISPLAKTVFANTTTPLQLWFYTMLHLANSAESANINSIQRHLGISRKAAYRMLTRIRFQMAAIDSDRVVGRPGEAVMIRLQSVIRVRTGRGMRNRVRYLIMGTDDDVLTYVVGHARRHKVRAFAERRAATGSMLITDCPDTFNLLSEYGSRIPLAQFINDGLDDYFDTTNTLRAFQNYFRRPLQIQHKRVDMDKLWLYLKEYEFRFNRRYKSKSIFPDLISNFPVVTCSEMENLQVQNSGISVMEKLS